MNQPHDHPLPPGWRWVRLGEVCEIIAGQSPPGETYRKIPGGMPFFQGKADFGSRHPTARVWCVAPTKIALPGDILISVRAPVGPTNIADVTCCIGRGLAAIRCGDQAERDFILAALKLYESDLAALGSGSTFSAVNRDQLESIKIPLPPLAEQQRIAALLNQQMAVVERTRAAAETQLEAAMALPGAYLREVFEGAEARGWPRKRISQLCSRIDYGYTASADPVIEEPRFLRITDIQEGSVDWEKVPGCHISPHQEAENRLEDGDIVFARTGGTTGKSFLVRNPPRSVFASYLIRLRPTGDVAADYLYAFLQSDDYWRQIRRDARGGAQPNVNASLLGAIMLPVAPSGRQGSIIARLGKYVATADRVRQALTEQLALINGLPAALLRRAFNGEL